jgi:hypothetical protein
MIKHRSFPIVTGLAIAASVACSNNNPRNSNGSNSTAANPPAAGRQLDHAPKAVTLTGCLQQDGRTYIVTHLNEPSREGVGTTGNGAAVEREQLREAANAYRVESKDQSDWDKMVGKQVRVSGSLDKAADLPAPAGPLADRGDRPGPTSGSGVAGIGTAGSTEAGRREKLDKGDLAHIAVESMTVVSENCGGTETPGSTATKPAADGPAPR